MSIALSGIPYIEESRFVTNRVVDLYEARGVPTLDVAELIKDIPVEERMASPVDQHPGELVHGIVAESLYKIRSLPNDIMLDVNPGFTNIMSSASHPEMNFPG